MAPSLLSKGPSLEDLSYRSFKAPYSNPQSSLEGIELLLEEQWKGFQAATSQTGVDCSTMLKAAWIVTLQCFQLSDVTCFSYRVDGPETCCSDNEQLVYSHRADPEETLLSFLEQIDRTKPSLTAVAPESYEIQESKKAASQVACNSSIRFIEQKARPVGPQRQRPRTRDAEVGR